MRTVDVQEVQEKIGGALNEVHSLLVERGIPYWIDGGTLLGAVRYGTFIPWDDDADICIPRPFLQDALDALGTMLPHGRALLTSRECPMAVNAKVVVEGLEGRSAEGPWYPMGVDLCSVDPVSHLLPEGLLRLSRSIAVRNYAGFVPERPRQDGWMNRGRRRIWDAWPVSLVGPVQEAIRWSHLLLSPRGADVTYGIGTACSVRYFTLDSVLPLKEVLFHGAPLQAPVRPDIYLTSLYGEGFLEPPGPAQRAGHFVEYRSS